jgi:hypothetical protein
MFIGSRVLAMKAIAFPVLLIICATVALSQQQTQKFHDPAALAKWQALIPSIESSFAREGHKCPAEDSHIGIIDAADFHVPDGPSVALVDWCRGGAYTDWIVAMQIEDGKPVLSRFTNADGKADPVEFLQGASVMHGANVKLVPEKNAIYGINWDNDQEMHLSCGANAYVWNPKTKAFRLDKELTSRATRIECEKLQQ